MNLFKKSALVAALAAACVASAQAQTDVITQYPLVNVLENDPGTGQYYPLDRTLDFDGNPVPAKKAGDLFDDVFVLSVFDPQTFSMVVNGFSGLTVDGVAVFDLNFDTEYTFGSYSLTSTSFLGTGLSLTAGQYAIDVFGTVLADGASYTGAIYNAAAVPEPQEWALLLGGLGMVGVFGRRRAKTVA
jgi:hypothetical protein